MSQHVIGAVLVNQLVHVHQRYQHRSPQALHLQPPVRVKSEAPYETFTPEEKGRQEERYQYAKNTANPHAAPCTVSLSVRKPCLLPLKRTKGALASAGTSLTAAPKPKEAQAAVSAALPAVLVGPSVETPATKALAAARVRATSAS